MCVKEAAGCMPAMTLYSEHGGDLSISNPKIEHLNLLTYNRGDPCHACRVNVSSTKLIIITSTGQYLNVCLYVYLNVTGLS